MVGTNLIKFATTFLIATINTESFVKNAAKRYDYKRSFKRPMKIGDSIPGYDVFGDAEVSDEYIRLSSSIPGSQGSIWGKEPNSYEKWQVDYNFYMSTRGTIGKDGIVFWYTKETGKSGPVFGNQDFWSGLGIVVDAFTKPGSVYVYTIDNDGTKQVAGNSLKVQKGSCELRFLKVMGPVYVRVKYANNKVEVTVDPERHGNNYLNCFTIDNMALPSDYYFGLSASSSEPASDHDLIQFSLFELDPPRQEHDMSQSYEHDHLKDGVLKASAEETKKLEDIEELFKDFNNFESDETEKETQQSEDWKGAQDKTLKALDYLAYRVDKVLPQLSGKPESNDGVIRKDINLLSSKVEALTKALNDAQTLLTQLESQVSTATQSQQSDFQAVTSHVTSLSQKINNMLQNGKFDGMLVDSKFSEVSSRLWNLLLMGLFGGLVFLGYLYYRSRSQPTSRSATQKPICPKINSLY